MDIIKSTGMEQGDLVELLYMLVNGQQGLGGKLDADTGAGVVFTDYRLRVYTQAFDTVMVENLAGQRVGGMTDARGWLLSPLGLRDDALVELLYELYYSMYTLCTRLDADGLAAGNFETTVYDVYCTYRVDTGRATIGAAAARTFSPHGVMNQDFLVDYLYDYVAGVQLLCQKLDGDANVNDTNYEALWYTANITKKVMNNKGQTIGN